MLISVIVKGFNGLLTISFVPFLYNIYRKKQKKFYLYWSIGFLLYGVNNLIRTSLLYFNSTSLLIQLLSFISLSVGFGMVLVGIGDLIRRRRLMLFVSISIPVIMTAFYATTKPYELAKILAIIPYAVVSLSLLWIKRRYSVQLDLFIVGWWMLLISNIGYSMEYMGDVITDVFAIFSKMVIFYGMTNPQFTLLADNFERFMLSGDYSEYTEGFDWHLMMVGSKEKKEKEVQWLINRVNQNSAHGIRTILISVYDLVSQADLQAQGALDLEALYLIRVQQTSQGGSTVFSEKTMTIRDDVNELEAVFSDIINFANERKVYCQIILFNLSVLIFTHGWKRLYSFLISMMPRLKSSNVQVCFLYHPLTHSSQSEINIFESLADQITVI
jgi:hypothetical protein